MSDNNQETLDYLKKIHDINKKRLFWTRISVGLVAVLVVLIAIVVPVVVETLNTAQTTMNMANDAIAQAQSIMDDMTTTIASMDEAVGSITKLVGDSSEGLVQAFDNINSIDFQGLNDAIVDLGNVVEPLSKFFGKFK